MAISRALFSSESEQWETPADLVEKLSGEFNWDVDTCASRPNVCARYWDEEEDALSQEWDRKLMWMNPPYGRKIGLWMSHARRQSARYQHTSTICLVPARTDTNWWQNNIGGNEDELVVFIKGRLKFGSDQFWIDHFNKEIMKPKTTKQITEITKKIGGALCEKQTRKRISELAHLIFKGKKTYPHWESADYIRKDAAPFPSAFVVYGWRNLNTQQQELLASFGKSAKMW